MSGVRYECSVFCQSAELSLLRSFPSFLCVCAVERLSTFKLSAESVERLALVVLRAAPIWFWPVIKESGIGSSTNQIGGLRFFQ